MKYMQSSVELQLLLRQILHHIYLELENFKQLTEKDKGRAVPLFLVEASPLWPFTVVHLHEHEHNWNLQALSNFSMGGA